MTERLLFYWQSGLFLISIFALGTPSAAFARGELPESRTVPADQLTTLKSKGTLQLEEFKSGTLIQLAPSESRLFQIKNRIIRTQISDPGIAEPVVFCEDQFAILGKSPGVTALGIWDDAGNMAVFRLRVHEKGSLRGEDREEVKQIPRARISPLPLEECVATKNIDLTVGESKLLKVRCVVVRESISNPEIVGLKLVAENAVNLYGKAPGKATVFIWDSVGNIEGATVTVTGNALAPQAVDLAKPKVPEPLHPAVAPLEVEYWQGVRKDVITPPAPFVDAR